MSQFNDAFASLKLPPGRLRVVGDISFLNDDKKQDPIAPAIPPAFRVVKSTENQPSKPPCIRCGGRGEIPMVARGRSGGSRGGVVSIRCPVCKGTGK